MSAVLTEIAWTLGRRRRQMDPTRHPMSRDERRWYRTQAAHAAAFGQVEATRIATLHVYDLDPKAEAGLGPTGVTRGH